MVSSAFSQGCTYSVNIQATHVACYGDFTGSAIAQPQPAGSYTYVWSTGETSQGIEHLQAQTYFVKVTDSKGCEIIEFITITQPPKLEVSAEIIEPKCFNENSGSVSLSVSGGVEPYAYNWSNNVTTAENKNIYSGTYSVTVTDDNFCEITESYTLNQPDRIVTSAVVENVRGYGLSDGSIDITTEGGEHPYTYEWSNTSGFSGSTEDVYLIPSDTYSLTIFDTNMCQYDTSIFVSQPPPLEMTSTITDVYCYDNSDGSVEVSVSGGVPPYTYVWEDSAKKLNNSTETLRSVPTGYYYVTATDNNQISVSDSFFVDQPNEIVAYIETVDAYCFDSLNGHAYLSVSGGMPPYTYVWSNGIKTQNNQYIHAGDYSVEIVDMNGCFRRMEATVEQPDSIEIHTQVRHITCKDHHNGIITTDVEGGIPPYSYNWSNGKTDEYIDMLDVGKYTVTVTDAHNCPMSVTKEVRIPINGCISIPNAFTPNGDNYNDVWEIENYYLYPDIEVLVYNKDGHVVFESIGYHESWNGTYNNTGNNSPSGTYYYVVNLHNGDPIYKGIVTLMR